MISVGINRYNVRADDRVHRYEDWFPASNVIGSDQMTSAGVSVNASSVLTLDAWFACIRNASEDLAKLPLITYERLDRGRRRAQEQDVYDLLHIEPNPEMTAMSFIETINAQSMANGGGFAIIKRDASGYPASLWPIQTSRVQIKRDRRGELVYDVWPNGSGGRPSRYRSIDMLHIHGLGAVGTNGYVMSSVARESIALGLATREYASQFFKNDATPRTVIMYPQKLSDAAQESFRQKWQEGQTGANRHRMAVLQEGMKVHQLQVNPVDAMLIDMGHYTIESMCRWFRMPPHKVQHLLRSTFSNITEQNLEYVIDCLDSLATRWQQEISRKLFTKADRKRFYVEFLFDKMLRGDPVKRAQVQRIEFSIGKRSINELREMDNENPVEGGDDHLVPLNMRRIQDDPPGANNNGTGFENTDIGNREAVAQLYRGLLIDAIGRVVRVESRAFERAIKKPGEFDGWVNQYFDSKREFYFEQVAPLVKAFVSTYNGSAADSDLIAETVAENHATACKLSAMSQRDHGDIVAEWNQLIEVEADTILREAKDAIK